MKSKQLLVFLSISVSLNCLSQTNDSVQTYHHFSGAATVTNNGISLIPTFSLGKPAVLVLLSLGGKRFSVDPDIRFSLAGKPWVVLFWARYKLINEGKFRLNTGMHLGMNFRNLTLSASDPTEIIAARRYLAAELAPNYFVAKNISIGSYYLYSHGMDYGAAKNTHFVTFNTNFSHITLSKKIYLRAVPQVYYLYQDGMEGYFFTSAFTLARQNFPLSVSSIINKLMHSNKTDTRDFVWNISLNYSFSKNYVPKTPVL